MQEADDILQNTIIDENYEDDQEVFVNTRC